MNDRHPSGTATPPAPASEADPAHYASYGHQEATYGDFTTYGDYTATGFDAGTGAHANGTFAADPLFGDMPGNDNGTGSYDASQWSTGSHQTLNYDPYAAQHQAAYDTGSYDTTSWSAGYEHLVQIPAQSTGPDASGQWDASGWLQPEQSEEPGQSGPSDQTQQWVGTQHFDTGAFDATQWNTDGTPAGDEHGGSAPESYDAHEHPRTEVVDFSAEAVDFAQQATATFEQLAPYDDQDQPLPRTASWRPTAPTAPRSSTTRRRSPRRRPRARAPAGRPPARPRGRAGRLRPNVPPC